MVRDQLQSALAGRYTVEREVGHGGMATVYLASDLKHERRVALKVLNPELGAVLGVERFLSEIRLAANRAVKTVRSVRRDGDLGLLPLFDSGEAEMVPPRPTRMKALKPDGTTEVTAESQNAVLRLPAMPDGRLVVLVPVDEGLQLNVIVNWAEELAKRTSTSSTAR
jgi:hypothetical protein